MTQTKRQKKKLQARRLKKVLIKRDHLQAKLAQLVEKMMTDAKNSIQKKDKEGQNVSETTQPTPSRTTD